MVHKGTRITASFLHILTLITAIMKKIKYYILAIFSVLTLSLFSLGSVSAVSDVSVTYNSTPTVNTDVFPTCTDNSCLSQYSYVIVEVSSPVYTSLRLRSLFDFGNANYLNVSTVSGIYSLPSSMSQFKFYSSADVGNYPWSSGITFTLTESYQSGITPEGNIDLSSNGTFDVTNYATATVEVEESSFIVQLFSKGFWGVATAIVTIVVPIIALFIVFRLVHDLLWGRG